jgi:hypothetical protein
LKKSGVYKSTQKAVLSASRCHVSHGILKKRE